MLSQSTLGILLLVLVAVAITTGDYAIGGVGVWSTLIFVPCLLALWRSFRYDQVDVWRVPDDENLEVPKKAPPESNGGEDEPFESLESLSDAGRHELFQEGLASGDSETMS